MLYYFLCFGHYKHCIIMSVAILLAVVQSGISVEIKII